MYKISEFSKMVGLSPRMLNESIQKTLFCSRINFLSVLFITLFIPSVILTKALADEASTAIATTTTATTTTTTTNVTSNNNLPEEVKVDVSISEDVLRGYSPRKREIVRLLLEEMKEKLSYYEKYPIVLPPTAFSLSNGQIINMGDFFLRPTDGELSKLALDENGLQKNLTREQLAQLEREGFFTVDSVEFPGQKHLWKLNVIFQKGSKNIKITFEQGIANALGQIIIEIPDRLTGEGYVSVQHGLINLSKSLRGVLSNFVGLSEMSPRYLPYEIDKMVEDAKNKYILSEAGKFLEDGRNFDPRLYDKELNKKLEVALSRIFNEHEEAWKNQIVELRIKFKKEFANDNVTFSQIKEKIDLKLEEQRLLSLDEMIVADKMLEELSPGFGQLYVNHQKAGRISLKIENELAQKLEAFRIKTTTDLRNNYPIRSKIPRWLSSSVEAETQKYYRQIRWDHLAQIPKALREAKLNQEAFIFERNIEFMKEQETTIRAGLSEEEIAAKNFEFANRIWKSENWIKKEIVENGEVRYYPSYYNTNTISTDSPLWRLRMTNSRTHSYIVNTLYYMLVENLWNGPLGVRALFSEHPFYGKKIMDPKTGEIIDDKNSLIMTLNKNLKNLWENVYQARADYENAPNTGLLDKGLTRWLNMIWNYGIKGVLGSIAYTVGQPLVTMGNVALSGGVAATSVVWAPMTSLFQMGFNMTIYDFDSPANYYSHSRMKNYEYTHVWFPALNYTKDVIFSAAVPMTMGTLAATVLHPTLSALTVAFEGARKLFSQGWDALMRKLIIAPYGKIPATDSWVATRVSGPGISVNYFYQIHPEMALVALQAKLESIELSQYADRNREEIKRPLNTLNDFFSGIFSQFRRMFVGGDNGVEARIEKLTEDQLKALGSSVEERRKVLEQISKLPIMSSLIRQTNEDLQKTYELSIPLVQNFYEEKIFAKMKGPEIREFWWSKELEEDDYLGLSKILYSQIFSEKFMIPMEKNDETFVIEIKNEDLEHFLHRVLTNRNSN
ncbi:MAG: hypothetical protein HQK49_08630 [Oligoflexia bacterium]|nr:hypothetical protein [Oligoflexia bacterium]